MSALATSETIGHIASFCDLSSAIALSRCTKAMRIPVKAICLRRCRQQLLHELKICLPEVDPTTLLQKAKESKARVELSHEEGLMICESGGFSPLHTYLWELNRKKCERCKTLERPPDDWIKCRPMHQMRHMSQTNYFFTHLTAMVFPITYHSGLYQENLSFHLEDGKILISRLDIHLAMTITDRHFATLNPDLLVVRLSWYHRRGYTIKILDAHPIMINMSNFDYERSGPPVEYIAIYEPGLGYPEPTHPCQSGCTTCDHPRGVIVRVHWDRFALPYVRPLPLKREPAIPQVMT